MDVAGAVGLVLARHRIDHVFGVVGSGNFHVTNALVAAGARFVPAAHEGGAASMADGYARVAGRPCALTVHQGPGVTNALTGITEAAKSRTPVIVLAPEVTNPRSNFFLDLAAVAAAVGAEFIRVRADRVAADVHAAVRAAIAGAGATVLLALPLDVQAQRIDPGSLAGDDLGRGEDPAREAAPAGTAELVDLLTSARRPVFIAGRGAARRTSGEATWPARAALLDLSDRCGALLATSAAAKGLFAGCAWQLDVSGGFATPLAAELIATADLVVAWGSTLNMWTTRHGRLIPPGARVVQVDLDPEAIGANRPVDLGVVGEVSAVARACTARLCEGLAGRPVRAGDETPVLGWRTAELADRIARSGRWRDVSYVDESGSGRIDPRTLSIALDDLLPPQRTVVIDSGNFMGYPSMFLSVPDAAGFCFTQAFQSIGLGLASAIGAAIARPDRCTVAAVGDGGMLMSSAELSTVARLGLPLLVVVYNDNGYGAEVHHFGPSGYPLDVVRLPDTDFAAIAAGFGWSAGTVRSPADLAPLADWLRGPRSGPYLVDAKVVSEHGSWWLEDAFRGH
jgi:acetolactate synthase I/II/III large subunit